MYMLRKCICYVNVYTYICIYVYMYVWRVDCDTANVDYTRKHVSNKKILK